MFEEFGRDADATRADHNFLELDKGDFAADLPFVLNDDAFGLFAEEDAKATDIELGAVFGGEQRHYLFVEVLFGLGKVEHELFRLGRFVGLGDPVPLPRPDLHKRCHWFSSEKAKLNPLTV